MDPKEKKVPLKQAVYEKLEGQAKTEGKTADELASDIVLEKSTEKPAKGKGKSKKPTSDKPVFPTKGFVNAYLFLRLSNGIAEAFGAVRGKKTPVTIDFKDGSLIISKA